MYRKERNLRERLRGYRGVCGAVHAGFQGERHVQSVRNRRNPEVRGSGDSIWARNVNHKLERGIFVRAEEKAESDETVRRACRNEASQRTWSFTVTDILSRHTPWGTIEYTISSAARIIRRVNARSCSLSAILTAKSSAESIFRSGETRKWYIMRVELTVNTSDKPLACLLISTSIMLISNLTLAAAAGTVLNILNFPKENAIDLASGGCIELTPVQIFHASLTTNQHWTLSGGPSTFQIISKCGTFLTYPGAGSAIALRSQATTRANATAAWTIKLVNASAPAGPWNIFETPSNAALTAWDLHPGSALLDAPLTLEEFNSTDTRQQFWFATASGMNMVSS
ncbi:hypothetical protein B0H19DRAFT_1081498 [Mycena capillaripes]|nr:hypothetical protein B0H19DRAFT_1081498 [Mycena capillaripes]